MKILIVDDDEISEILISILVSEFDKSPIKTMFGKEAVEICRNNPNIDLILMDNLLPDLNGFEATRQIRIFNKKVIIIAQTADAMDGDKEKALEAGCTDYISKPIVRVELIELINRYFNK